MSLETVRYKASPCPYCGSMNDPATIVMMDEEGKDAPLPDAGSINLCMYCGNPSVFNENLKLRMMSAAEIQHLKTTDPDTAFKIKKAQKAITETMIERFMKK